MPEAKIASRRPSLGAVFTGGTAALLAALLFACGLLVHQTYQSNATSRAFGHASAIRTGLQRVLSQLQDAETGQRGYLLTGQERYLAPYTAAAHQLHPEIATLTGLLANEHDQHAQILKLETVAQRKMDELAQTIRLKSAGRSKAALAIVVSDQGLAQMEEARRIIGGLQGRQAREYAARLALRDAQFDAMVWTAGALVVILCLSIVFVGVMAVFHLRARDKIIADVRQLTDALGAEKATLTQTVRELDIAKTAADNANRAKSEFLASVSHELRTPLNAILGFSEIIRDELFGPVGTRQYADYAGDVHRSGAHLLDLINDILDLSKIDAGKVELHEENVDLDALLGESVKLVRERAMTGGVRLSFASAPQATTVFADRRLLKQILLNLLSNAIKFTPRGGSVMAQIFRTNDAVGFSVADSGIGMSAADIEKALSPYGQIDSKISRKHQGTGLGLPISHSLAKMHGGDLAIESTPDMGTTIALMLPVARRVGKVAASRA